MNYRFIIFILFLCCSQVCSQDSQSPPTLSVSIWYPWTLIAIAIFATTFPLLAHLIVAIGWGTICNGFFQRAVSIRVLTMALVIATGMWIGGVVLLVSSEAQTNVVNFQLKSTTNLLDVCFGGATKVKETAINVSKQTISEVSTNLSMQMVDRITDQLGAKLFNATMTPFFTTASFRSGQNISMSTLDGILAVAELLWLSTIPKPVTQILVADESFQRIIYYNTYFNFASIYQSSPGSYLNYAFNRITGKIDIQPECRSNTASICIKSGYTTPPLQDPPFLGNVTKPIWTKVFGESTGSLPYLFVYYPVFMTQTSIRLGWFGQQVNTSIVQSILISYCSTVQGSFGYILDDREILLAVSEGNSYAVTGSKAEPLSVYSNNINSSLIQGLAQQIKTSFTSHWKSPVRFAYSRSQNVKYAITIGDIVHYNLNWKLIFGLPDELVYGPVLRAEEDVSVRINTLKKDSRKDMDNNLQQTNKEVSSGLLQMFLWSLGVLFLCLIVAGILNWAIVSPLSRMVDILNAVAFLEVDLDPDSISTSALYEIRLISNALVQIVNNLKQLKAFIPSALFQGTDNRPTDDATVDKEKETEHSSNRSSRSKSTRTGANDGTGGIYPSNGTGLNLNNLSIMATRRIITLLVADIQGFNAKIEETPETALDYHKDIMAEICRIVSTTSGTTDRFFGDKVMVSWNALRRCGNHFFEGPRCAVALANALKNTPVRMALATGQGLFGTLGCEGMMSFSVVGTVVSEAFSIMQVARRLSAPTVLNHALWEKCQYDVVTRWIDSLSEGDGQFGKSKRVYQLIGSRAKQNDDEWMYQLQKQQNSQADELFLSAVQKAVDGNHLEAIEDFTKYLSIDGKDDLVASAWLALLNQQRLLSEEK